MTNKFITLVTIFALSLMASSAGAVTISLYDYLVGSAGGVSNTSGFDTGTGLGSVVIKYSVPGTYYAGLWVDHEIDEADNTFFNEFGAASGAPAAGQTWEIDEPEFGNPVTGYMGDIYTNFDNKSLDGKIFDGTFTGPEDVSMALAWDFILAASEEAFVTFYLSESAPTSGFYLSQADPDSLASVYFYSTFVTHPTGGGPPIPEPSTMALLGIGLAGLAVYGKKRSSRGKRFERQSR